MAYIVTVNAGSSSIKMALFDGSGHLLHMAAIENIGQAATVFKQPGLADQKISVGGHATAMRFLLKWLDQAAGSGHITAVGHRIVHGADKFTAPTVATSAVITKLQKLEPLDPDHLPFALECLKEARQHYKDAPHVLCFDTAFYKDLPRPAQQLALPRKYEKLGLRRYGFHGLSYQYLLKDFAKNEGQVAAHGKVIMAHLGSGVSLCATKDAKPIDMTMGFTPASGVPMSTRSGDLDPGVVWYLHRLTNMGPRQFNHLVNKQSGLLGVSGRSADMLTLLNSQDTDPHAKEAIDLFCYQIAKQIGGLAAALGGVNSLIFAGGIGERSSPIRRRICRNLSFLGIQVDSDRNRRNARLISPDGAPVGVHVIHTNEEAMIANLTMKTIKEEQ